MTPATITTEAGHTWWLCPNCRKRLAEIIGGRVVVEARDRRITIAVAKEPDQVCPKCGAISGIVDNGTVAA
jgi:rubrerythrin